jgi:hypothetical protein
MKSGDLHISPPRQFAKVMGIAIEEFPAENKKGRAT